jgi:hypothetical protein
MSKLHGMVLCNATGSKKNLGYKEEYEGWAAGSVEMTLNCSETQT